MKRLLRSGLILLPALLATEVGSQARPPRTVSAPVVTAPAPSTPDGFSPGLKTDPTTVLAEPETPKPAYLARVSPAPFGVPIMRIANDTGLPTTPVRGTWGTDARHVYSKQQPRSEEHTSELQSHSDLVCRLLLEKKNSSSSRPRCAPHAATTRETPSIETTHGLCS